MKIYKCEKCGSTDIFIECNENHHGLYCGDCGKWIKWLNKDEERLALRQIINQQSKNKNEASIRADERARVLDEVNALVKTRLIKNFALDNATKYGNKSAKQQANSYATVMKYEIADCVDDLLDDLEQLKEQNDE